MYIMYIYMYASEMPQVSVFYRVSKKLGSFNCIVVLQYICRRKQSICGLVNRYSSSVLRLSLVSF